MTAKFFGGERANIAYLLRNATAKVLKGAPEITSKIIESLEFSQRFCSGCLSFNESLSDSKIDQHIAEFESLIRAGLPNESINFLWILHRDKGRDELHFIIPQVDLITGRHLTIYLDRLDRELVNAFRDSVNIMESYTRPDDPARKKMTSIPFRVSATKKEFIAQIGAAIRNQVETGNVSNRDQVVEYLEKQGLLIKRGKRKQLPTEYLKVKRQEDVKFTSLRGAFYRADYTSPTALTTEQQGLSNAETLILVEEKLKKGVEQRAFRQAKRHEMALRAAQKRKSQILSPVAHTPEITLDAEVKPPPMAHQIAVDAAPEIQNHEANRTTNPFREIVDTAGGGASQRGGIFNRTTKGIRHLFEEFIRREQREASGAEDVDRIGLALDGCCSVLHRATVRLGGAVGALTAAIRRRRVNQRGSAYRGIPVAPTPPKILLP